MSGPNESTLRAGDEVKLYLGVFPGVVVSGPVTTDGDGCLQVGPFYLVQDGKSTVPSDARLEVTKLAPRPVYVNHDREEPVDGDVVRDAESSSRQIWIRVANSWATLQHGDFQPPGEMPKRMMLLVNGDTGTIVSPVKPDAEPQEHHH